MYGIFAGVWQVFRTEINAGPEKIDRIVMAAVCLHNFRITEKESIEEFFKADDSPRQSGNMLQLNTATSKLFDDSRGHSEQIRNELAEYFVNGGSVYWQDNLIN